MKNNVIIVAGGKGLRMGSELPKQFISIGGKPILMHTIDAFIEFDNDINIILVLHPSYVDFWTSLCEEYNFHRNLTITTGGDTRFHSVKNGLKFLEDGLVAVHDAARPFITTQLIDTCFRGAEDYDVAIPVIDSTDSLRIMLDDSKSKIVDRSKMKLVQTPQVFKVDILKKAYEADFTDLFTDDASVVEAMGVDIHLVKGDVSNIKITTPFDLEVSEIIIKNIQSR